jgi:ribosomal protein S18 acetylase RimI-like enzyme
MDFHPVEANLRESFRVLAAGRPRGDVLELPGVTIASLGVAFQMFNAAFLNGPVQGLRELECRLDLAARHFRSRDLPWALWICEHWLDRSARRSLTHACAQFGLRLSSEMPGMVAERLTPPKRPLPDLEIRRVDSAAVLDDFRGVGAVCFHVPLPWFSEVFDGSLPNERRGFVCWVAYHDGQPVATAATLAAHGVIGLYNIATAPGQRRRGFAEALTRYAAAAAGCAPDGAVGPIPLVLESTSLGFRLYGRLGFRTVTGIAVYNSG